MPDCPTCGKHCAKPQGLSAHMRSHDDRLVPCTVAGCNAMLRANSGLGRHLTTVHGINRSRRLEPVRRDRERVRQAQRSERERRKVEAKKDEVFRQQRLRATLERLAPSVAKSYLNRLYALSLKHAPERGAFAVIGVDFGPVMVPRVMVGQVVAKAGEACVVVDLNVLREAQEAAEIAARTRS